MKLEDPAAIVPPGYAQPPLLVWLAKGAAREVGPGLAGELPEAFISQMPVGGATGPAILVLSAADTHGPEREALLVAAHRALPGRPVFLGGTRNKDLMLEAINTWRAFRAVPERTPLAVVADAVRRAHEHVSAGIALNEAADRLRDETRQLDSAVAQLQAARARLLHVERLTTMGRITDGLIESAREHQQALDAFSEVAKPLTTDPELLQLLDIATEGTRSIATLLDEIQAYAQSRDQSYELKDECFDELVTRAVAFSRFDALGKERTLSVSADSGAKVRANRHRIYQVLLNLMRNAFQATQPGGAVMLRTRREGNEAVLEVEDTGAGMPDEVRARIFEPFFTTKKEAGLGLGLRISRAAIERHGGTITCESKPGVGTKFEIRLPCLHPSIGTG